MSRIKIRRYRIALPQRAGKPDQPVKIAVIGDLHNRVFGEANKKLVEAIMGQYPDMVLSVGDLTVTSPEKETNLDVSLSLLKRLSCECPVYCVNGNHEFRAKIYPETYPGVYEKLKSNFRQMGIALLEDSSVDIDVKNVHFTIHGFELPAKYYKKLSRDFINPQEIREHLGDPVEGRYNILLSHNPVYFESYALWGADLTLSGHLHGGLVRLPLVGGLISPQIKLFPKYCCGMYEKYGRKLVVTAGLGSHSFALRVNNPAEFVMLELF